jgi:predicted DNA-binding transcriptional regulator YafY
VGDIQTKGLVDEGRLKEALEAFLEAGEKGLSRQDLAGKLRVSLRTADRARELLAEQGARFESRSGGQRAQRRYVLTKGPAWDTRISKEARLALRVAAQALSHGGGHIFAEQLASLETLADKAMTSRDRGLFQNLRNNVRVMGGVADDPTEEQTRILESILMAFSHRVVRELELEYRRPGRTASAAYRLAPYCLTQDLLSGGTYLLGWDVEHRRVIQLRVSRITEARVTSRPGVILDPAPLERAARFQMGGWVSTQAPFDVRIRVRGSNWMQSLEEAQPDFPDFQIEQEKGGRSILVRFKANHLEGPTRWTLQMGGWAEVLDPPELREAVRTAAKELLAGYGD